MGLTINRPLDIPFSELLSQLNIPLQDSLLAATPIYQGGPVQTGHGFILHTNEFKLSTEQLGSKTENQASSKSQTLKINDYLSVSSSIEILSAIARNEGPVKYLITLGYCGWGAGQLEREMSENAWLHVPADYTIIFDTPDDLRWETAAEKMGIDIHLISAETGHA